MRKFSRLMPGNSAAPLPSEPVPIHPLGRDRIRIAIELQEGPASQQLREIEALALGRLRDRVNHDQPGRLHEVLHVRAEEVEKFLKYHLKSR